MQVNVNQDAAIRQYTQTAQKMGKTSTVAAEAPDMRNCFQCSEAGCGLRGIQ